MGFCLFNNVAVCAAALADRGERVAIVDWDVHHGNGTQDIFYADGRVLYVSTHQWPFYPGTGRLQETGTGDGEGLTVNLPFPVRTTGDVYRAAFDEVIGPVAERFAPTWVLVSLGFDAHRADPLAGLALSAGDYGWLLGRSRGLGPGRRPHHRLPRGRLRPRRARRVGRGLGGRPRRGHVRARAAHHRRPRPRRGRRRPPDPHL